jgi:guanylate kinase
MSEALHKVIILTAPSGAGKTSIAAYLLKQMPQLSFSVSATTRAPRGNEKQGVEYHFISLEKFEGHIHQNDFLEYEMVYEGVYYGTLQSELTRIWNLGKIPVLDIDVKGAISVQKQIGANCFSILILKERLENRKTETPESLEIRLDKAAYEISFSNQFNAIIQNNDLTLACTDTEKLITAFLQK